MCSLKKSFLIQFSISIPSKDIPIERLSKEFTNDFLEEKLSDVNMICSVLIFE
ncbi:hypothetical protein GCM10023116_10750 [Kistimonas scapharcae]|uniref:Uncharacterized protein n=1 Tax=Kistimonas scapharcae TaxID=1036133 RepID=A0ABP8UYW3_9GAMM